MNAVLNHLWQSTLFAGAAALAALALRRNSPRARYWLWLAASVKFLIPFSLLVWTGSRIELPPTAPSLHATTVEDFSAYFAPVAMRPPATPMQALFPWPRVLGAMWLFGVLFLMIRWLRRWHAIQIQPCRPCPRQENAGPPRAKPCGRCCLKSVLLPS